MLGAVSDLFPLTAGRKGEASQSCEILGQRGMSSGEVAFMRSVMPGLLPRAPERKSVIVLAR